LLNPNAFIPRISGVEPNDVNGNYNRITNRWVEDGSYLRLKNISLTYSVPKNIIAKQKFIKDVKITLSAQNLWTLTKYTGYDPEVGAFVGAGVGSADGSSTDLSRQVIGVDYNHYPLTRMYTFSVNVNL
jgi:hypothetical protein